MISLFKPYIDEEAIQRTIETLRSGYIAQGPRVDELEDKLRQKLQNDHIVTTNSCTSGLHIAYECIKKRLGIAVDDLSEISVLATPVTCAASNMAIRHAGFGIKWVDVSPDTLNLDVEDLQNRWSENTRILSITAWGGFPPNMWRLAEILDLYRCTFGRELYIVLDLAHAFGSTFARLPVCSINHRVFSCYSLQAIKSLTAGDGGVLVTPEWAYKYARDIRWFGLSRDDNPEGFRHRQDIQYLGYKYNLNDINASIALGNLNSIDKIIERQVKNSTLLRNEINNERIKHLGIEDKVYGSSCWLHSVSVKNSKDFISYLKVNEIESNPVHTANHDFSVFKKYYSSDLKVTNDLESKRCCIPCGWHLNDSDIDRIVQVCNAY